MLGDCVLFSCIDLIICTREYIILFICKFHQHHKLVIVTAAGYITLWCGSDTSLVCCCCCNSGAAATYQGVVRPKTGDKILNTSYYAQNISLASDFNIPNNTYQYIMSGTPDNDSRCANCGKGEEASISLKSCTACKLVKYCNRECQIAHRPQHKKECRKRAAELYDDKLYKEVEPEDCPYVLYRTGPLRMIYKQLSKYVVEKLYVMVVFLQ